MLRHYQIKALDEIKAHIANGNRKILLVMPTGSGKTTVFCEILKTMYFLDNHAILVVRGRKLVEQASDRLTREFVPHSVMMGNDKRRNDAEIIQTASVDTLFARKMVPNAKLIVIDEAHLAMSAAFDFLLDQYPDAIIIAVTATPFHKRGFKHMAEVIVSPVTVKDLIADGFLVPGRYFVPSVPDLSHVKKASGDYVTKDLAGAMNQARLFGPIVESYRQKALGRPALLFAVNISHSKRLCASFNESGISAVHIDSNHTRAVRDDAIQNLLSGRILVLCSVGLMLVGVDIPCVSVLIVARPTLSYNVHVQMLGRGTRPFPGKSDFIVLDHAGNTPKHGFLETYRSFGLDGQQQIVRIDTLTCATCYCTYSPKVSKSCPGILPDDTVCGIIPKVTESKPSKLTHDEDAKLIEALTEDELEGMDQCAWVKSKCREAALKGYKKGWAFLQIQKRYGKEVAKGSWALIRAAYA